MLLEMSRVCKHEVCTYVRLMVANDIQESQEEEELLWTTPIRLLQVIPMPNVAGVAHHIAAPIEIFS